MRRLGFAALTLLARCAPAAGTGGLRAATPVESGIASGRLDTAWGHEQLRSAARTLFQVFTTEGHEGLLRLRLHGDELRGLFTPQGVERVLRIPSGLSPSPGERRWYLFRALAESELVGFCARGARVTEENGPEGTRGRAFIVERLLLVGREHDGVWGAWVEGLALTTQGWRLLPSVPFERQVETPRRDHADVQFWDCDLGQRPQRDQAL